MKPIILDTHMLKKFGDDKPNKEAIWTDKEGNINLICMKPGQEIITHTHHGNHVWIVIEGKGEFTSSGEKKVIASGGIVIVPPLVDHGIRNASSDNLVIASITAKGD